MDIARASGGRTVVRPMFRGRPDLNSTITDVEPAAGLRAASSLQHATHRLTLEYVRHAREAGHCWAEIGVALGYERSSESGLSVADAAYDYASSRTDPWSRSFAWTCPACQATIIDRGPEAGHPEDSEQGHAGDCPRLAAAVAAWNASRDAEGLQ